MATRLAIREKQLETWTTIIQECRNSGMKTKDWLAENNISKDQYYYWFKQLRLAACMQTSGPQPELPVESEMPQIVKLECTDYQNDLDSCSSYSINQEKYLRRFLDDGEIPIDNNAAEQSIRSFCIGKKNWVMCDTKNNDFCEKLLPWSAEHPAECRK